MKIWSSFYILSLSLLAACGKDSVPPQDAIAAADNFGRESAALCLAEVVAQSAADQHLRDAQVLTQKMPELIGPWVAVGQQWVRKARISGDPGFYLNVQGCVDEALMRSPNAPSALALRGLVLMNRHRFAEARSLAEQMLALDAGNAIALGILSDAALELGDYKVALTAAQSEMAAYPGMAAHARGAYLSWLHGDSARAKELIRDALHDRSRADPEPAAWTFVEAARLFWHEGDYAGADALLAEALNWVADYPAALVLRARIALANDQAESAIAWLQRAHQQTATVESAWLLSDAFALIKSDEQAAHWHDQAVRLGAQSDRLTLGLMLATRNDEIERAVTLLEHERRERGGIQVDDAYAWALYRAGRLEEALEHSDRALRLGTPDARMLYHAGAIRIALGRSDEGQALIVRALALNPEFGVVEAVAARSLLEGLGKVAQR